MAQFTPGADNPSNDERLRNVTFPQARSDINANLEALQTLNSGPSAPGANAPYMPWLDTSANPALLKLRHPSNANEWITIGAINTSNGSFAPKGVTDIANGGTGATSLALAQAALLPDQSGNSNKQLTTDGNGVLSWALGSIFDTYTFNWTGSPEDFTVPGAGNLAFIFLWGGGGGGSTRNDSGGDSGGGGGGCCFGIFPLSQLGSQGTTISVNIGQGGYQSSNDSSGVAGGSSTFGTASDSFYLKANGGEGGIDRGRGGYGGQIYDLGYANPSNPTIGGFAGGQGVGYNPTTDVRATIFGGAGGARGNSSTSARSVMGGNGGIGGQGNGTAEDPSRSGDGTKSTGTVPGGGGGGRANSSDAPFGAGGNGQCKIYII